MIESKTDVGTGTNIILDGITQGNIIFVLFQRNGREVEPQTQLTIVFFKKRYFKILFVFFLAISLPPPPLQKKLFNSSQGLWEATL